MIKKELIKNELKKELYIYSMLIIFTLSIAGLGFSSMLIMAGYQNFDYGHNLNWLNSEYGLSLGDEMSSGSFMSPSEMIGLGLSQMRGGLVLFFISVWMLGSYVTFLEVLLRAVYLKK